MTVTLDTIRRLDEMHDPLGVLSIYVDGPTPGRRARLIRTVCLVHKLRVLAAAVDETGRFDRGRALAECVQRIQPRLRRLLDDDRRRGRALFAALGGDDVRELAMEMPLETQIALDETAYVRPLVMAYDEGRPAGVVSYHFGGLQLFEWRMGRLDDLDSLEFRRAGEDPVRHAIDGSAPGAPRRADPNRDALIHSLARRIVEVAETHGWRRLVVAGDPRLAYALRGWLAAPVTHLPMRAGQFDRRSTMELAAALEAPLHVAQRKYESALVADTVERALSDQTAVLGMPATLRALEAGRARHLLFEADRDHRDALPFVDTGIGYGVDSTERLIELALAGGADITPLEGQLGGALAQTDGVAAILR